MLGLLGLLSGLLPLYVTPKQPREYLESVHPKAVHLKATRTPDRTLVGDWELPQAVVVVFTQDWPETLGRLVEVVSSQMPVFLLLENGQSIASAQSHLDRLKLSRLDRVFATSTVVDSVWARDYAPLQAWGRDGLVWLDSQYTDNRPLDDAVPEQLARWTKTPLEPLPYTLDGGAVASNGEQFCVATLDYFAASGIDWHDSATTTALLAQIGCHSLVLTPALSEEETKHADAFLQFISPSVVAISSYDPATDPVDAARMDVAAQAVEAAASAASRPLRVVRVPALSPEGSEYPSYTNFLALGPVALVPSYGDTPRERERAAFDVLSQAMEGVELVAVPADSPSDYGGAVHCLTWGLLHRPSPG